MDANDIAWAVDNGIRSGFVDIMADFAKIMRENSEVSKNEELEAKLAVIREHWPTLAICIEADDEHQYEIAARWDAVEKALEI
jgi:hypothetical protein